MWFFGRLFLSWIILSATELRWVKAKGPKVF
jgi:hypothetical protein